ncbi:hypothetical protein PYCC9005_004899 [Savitreella phatthalungensis]
MANAANANSSSKGKRTDEALYEKCVEEIKNKPNKDGSGKGQWAAWKSAEAVKLYESKGGGYEGKDGSKNEPKKGAPEPKKEGSSGGSNKKASTDGNKSPAKKDDKKKDESSNKREVGATAQADDKKETKKAKTEPKKEDAKSSKPKSSSSSSSAAKTKTAATPQGKTERVTRSQDKK